MSRRPRPLTVTESRRRLLPRGRTVYLRRPVAADVQILLALHRASARLYRGLASPMTTTRACAAYVARASRPDYCGMLVCRRMDDQIVGAVNISQIVRGGFQSAYMGYQAFTPYAGHGYMTAAMPLALRVVFRHLRLHRVEANIQPGNTASIALVTRAGFVNEGYSERYLKIAGRWRDHERWAITVERWSTQRRSARAVTETTGVARRARKTPTRTHQGVR